MPDRHTCTLPINPTQVHGDMERRSTTHLTPVEVADAAWLHQNALTARSSSMMMSPLTPNLPAYAAASLNVNLDGSPLTYRTATNGPESDDLHAM